MLKKWLFLPVLALPLPVLISCAQTNSNENSPSLDLNKVTISFQEQSVYNFGKSNEDVLDPKFDQQWIQDTIIANKDQIFKLEKGNWSDVNLEQNLIIEIIKKQAGQINFKLSLKDLIDQAKLITFSGFRIDQLSTEGATINGLKIDRFAQIIQLLDLNPFSDWTKLNNDFFKSKLIGDYAKLSLTIKEGSNNKNDDLKLILNGQFKNQTFKDEQIIISGFFNNQTKQDFQIINLDLNWANYFDQFQPLAQNETNLTFATDLDILKSFINHLKIQFDHYEQIIDLDKINQLFEIEQINLISNNQQMIWKLQLKSKFVIYKNDSWQPDLEQVSFYQKTNNKYAINLPTLTQLLEFIINSFTFKDEELKTYYPSYFYGLFKSGLNAKANLTGLLDFIDSKEIINKYKDKYFPNKDYFAQLDLDENTFRVDDQKGELSFALILKNQASDQNSDPIVHRQFSTNKLKSINDFINQEYKETFDLKDESTILRIIKSQYKSDIDKVKNDGQKIEKNINKNLIQNYATIYRFSNDSLNGNASKEFELQLFSQKLEIIYANQNEFTSNSLNLTNGLYTLDDQKPHESFFIEAIQIDSDDQDLPIIFIKENQGVKVEIKTKLKILLANNLMLEHPLTISKLITN